LLKSAGYKFWYDGWGKLVVTTEAYDKVLLPAINRGELDLPIDCYERGENTSWFN
jgi:hypothetical protein